MDYEREQMARQYSKEKRDGKLSREERRERDEAKDSVQRKIDEAMEAVREFNEARAKDKEGI